MREYTEQFYLPAAENYRKRAANNGALARQIVDWQQALDNNWDKLGFGDEKVNIEANEHHIELQIYLGDLDPKAVKVELYSDALAVEMKYQGKVPNAQNTYLYSSVMPASQSIAGFTPRILPHFSGVSVPLETNQILWQR